MPKVRIPKVGDKYKTRPIYSPSSVVIIEEVTDRMVSYKPCENLVRDTISSFLLVHMVHKLVDSPTIPENPSCGTPEPAKWNGIDILKRSEEIPSTNQQEKSNKFILDDSKTITLPNINWIEVEKAREELSRELNDKKVEEKMDFKYLVLKYYNDLADKAQNLLNALESMDESNIPEKGGYGIVEDAKENYDLSAVTRLEIIDNKGRSYVNLRAKPIEFFYQDNGKTLKIFCSKDQVEEECELEQSTDEWNTTEIREEKESKDLKCGYYKCKKTEAIYALTTIFGDHAMIMFDAQLTENQKIKPEYHHTIIEIEKLKKDFDFFEKSERKPKSIWKDIEKIDKKNGLLGIEHYLLRIKYNDYKSPNWCYRSLRGIYDVNKKCFIADEAQMHTGNLAEYCSLTDFINAFEDLQERVKKLEEK